jgi:CRISPR-associated endonuclease Csn1
MCAMQTIWGFDLGVTSVGWAVISQPEGNPGEDTGKVLRMGVRIFPETREPAKAGGPGEALNATRRIKRLMRRTLRRKRWRRVKLREALTEAGLLPPEAIERDDKRRQPPAGQDPYALRARGLTEALAPHDVGWALLHLLKRRGYQGSRKRDAEEKAPAKDADDEAKATARRAMLAQEIARADGTDPKHGTLGLALALRQDAHRRIAAANPTAFTDPPRLRDAAQGREMVQTEFDRLWHAQAKHHPSLLTDALRDRIDAIALAQRPTFFRSRTVGKCVLEPKHDRALKADWLTQRFEMLQLVNGLRFDHGNKPPLLPDQRKVAFAYLDGGWVGDTDKPSWAGLRKALGLTKRSDPRFTHERGQKETIRGNATEGALRKALGPVWDTLEEPTRHKVRAMIGDAVRRAEYRPVKGGGLWEIRDKADMDSQRADLASRGEAELGLPPDAAKALSEIELPDGHGRHARVTMEKLLPHLEAGDPYMTAVEREYGARRDSIAPLDKLPGPNASEVMQIKDRFVQERMQALLAGIRNPTVLRTLGELQKVVNTLLRVHGRPDMIRLEFARDLKQSTEERGETDRKQSQRERARKAAAIEIAKLGKVADGDMILRYLLWQEQGGLSPYSGQCIGAADALSADATEIDHIFPVSRSFDDSQANKVLCFVGENRDKRRRTPFEWLSADADKWGHLTGTVWPNMAKSGWPGFDAKHKRKLGKWARCAKEKLEESDDEGFTNRQLTDTAFIAKAAREYLGLLWGGGQDAINKVQPVAGRATGLLRRAWGIGLSRLLHGEISDGPKVRDDHRHHAVDALCVALCDARAVNGLSRWWQVRETTGAKPDLFAMPWDGFRQQTKAAVDAIVVSHRVQAKLSGALHEEQPMGDTGLEKDGAKLFARRKPVTALSANEITGSKDAAIADQGVRNAILRHLAAKGISEVRDIKGKKFRTTLSVTDKARLAAALSGKIRLAMTDSAKGHTGQAGPVIKRVRLHIKRGDVLLRAHPTKNAHMELGPGTNHHLAIYRDGTTVRHAQVTRRVALGRVTAKPPLPPVATSHPDGGVLVFAISPGDVLMRQSDARRELVLVRKVNAEGRIFHKPLTQVGQPDVEVSLGPACVNDGWRKVSIDPIGRIRRAK